MILIGLKSWSVRPCPDICRHAKFHSNPCAPFEFSALYCNVLSTNIKTNFNFVQTVTWLASHKCREDNYLTAPIHQPVVQVTANLAPWALSPFTRAMIPKPLPIWKFHDDNRNHFLTIILTQKEYPLIIPCQPSLMRHGHNSACCIYKSVL